MGKHKLAQQRIRQVSAAIDGDHVAGFGQVERLVKHQIVTRPTSNRERGTAQIAAPVHRAEIMAARSHPAHSASDIGARIYVDCSPTTATPPPDPPHYS